MSTLFSTCTVTDQCALYSVCINGSGTVNVLKVLTLINSFCFRCSNFRNYISEKVLVFEILECGLYHEQKRYICMSKCGRNVLKRRRYASVLSSHFLFFNLIKTAARTESIKCPACAVFAKSIARHVHVMSLN